MENLLKIAKLSKDFGEIRRKIVFAKDSREENDAEHSFQLALLSWYIISSKSLPLNMEKAFKYALAHDLVEVYAGDTPASVHKGFAEEQKTKHEREASAALR